MSNVALITGITGQDGSYLAELLLAKGYTVHGLIRRTSIANTQRIDHLYQEGREGDSRLTAHYGDLTDSSQLTNLIYEVRPQEIYNLAAQSHVRVSFDMPDYTANVTGVGALRILEAIRKSGVSCRFYQASTSEMFGAAPAPQNEQSPFCPQSPYAIAKLYAFWMVRNYREGYRLFACNGIMFNHESPRRGETFVSRKIARAVAAIVAGTQKKLYLGNLDARRDWGYAPEYVEAMWLMLQQDAPDDLTFGTGETHSVREFVEAAFGYVGLDWHEYVGLDPRYLRPSEVPMLQADCSEAKRRLGWMARIGFRDLVRIMVDAELQALGVRAPSGEHRSLPSAMFPWLQRP